MTLNLKIEILKVFTFDFSFSSEKKEEPKDVEENVDLLDCIKQSSSSK